MNPTPISIDATVTGLKARGALDILLIEDEKEWVHLIREHLAREVSTDVRLTVKKTLQDGMAFAREHHVDAVLLDLFLPDSRGLQTVSSFRSSAPKLPVIVLTSFNAGTIALEALHLGAQDYLIKDQISNTLLIRIIRYALERNRLQRDLDETNKKLGNFNKELEKQVRQRTAKLEKRRTELKNQIAKRERVEKSLQGSEKQYTQLIHSLKDRAVFLLNTKGRILVWNRGAERITGYKASAVLGERVSHLFTTQKPGLELRKGLDQVKSVGTFEMEGWAGRKGKPPFWAETVLNRLVDREGKMTGVSVIMQDATRRKKAEEAMKGSLRAKEVLLKEIHHRVKNNHQIILSLLRLQAEKTQNKETAAFFLESQERVRAMAMVHEYLYKSPDLARIDFPAYVASLVRNLYRTFGVATSEHPPRVLVDDVQLSLDMAAPCGLLLTELISNAAKFAYPDKKSGPIDVRFRKLADGFLELSVADEGVGFPENFDWTKSDSLGLRLVRLLTEQLQGEVRCESRHGIKFVVTFKNDVTEEGTEP